MAIIREAHLNYISNFRHMLDIKNKRDLILTQSSGSLKIWNVNNIECIYDFRDILFFPIESCFLNYQQQIYIVISDSISNEQINIFDLKGNKVKKLMSFLNF